MSRLPHVIPSFFYFYRCFYYPTATDSYARLPHPFLTKMQLSHQPTTYATQAGIETLEKGGNAIDAAIAVQFALAVTLPRAGNIGGGGFMMLHLASGDVKALDFREKAPSRATRHVFGCRRKLLTTFEPNRRTCIRCAWNCGRNDQRA